MSSLATLNLRWNQLLALAANVFPRLGLVLLTIAALFALHSWLGTRGLARATAVAAQNTAVQAPDGTVLYTTRLRFRLPSGQNILFADPIQSTDADDPTFATGALVPVLYPSSNPAAARVATLTRLYPWAIAFGVLGAALLDLGLFVRWRSKRAVPEAA